MADGILKVGTITNSAGSGNITIGSGVTLQSNVPAFQARLSADQSISNDSVTKLQIDTELFDTDNCYDNSTNYRFTPTVAGKYLLYAQVTFASVSDNSIQLRIYKNGSLGLLSPLKTGTGSASNSVAASIIFEANGTSDYFEAYGYQDSGSAKNANGASTQDRTYFGAYRIGA